MNYGESLLCIPMILNNQWFIFTQYKACDFKWGEPHNLCFLLLQNPPKMDYNVRLYMQTLTFDLRFYAQTQHRSNLVRARGASKSNNIQKSP